MYKEKVFFLQKSERREMTTNCENLVGSKSCNEMTEKLTSDTNNVSAYKQQGAYKQHL